MFQYGSFVKLFRVTRAHYGRKLINQAIELVPSLLFIEITKSPMNIKPRLLPCDIKEQTSTKNSAISHLFTRVHYVSLPKVAWEGRIVQNNFLNQKLGSYTHLFTDSSEGASTEPGSSFSLKIRFFYRWFTKNSLETIRILPGGCCLRFVSKNS